MKKILIYILLLVILFIVGRQIYWLIEEKGNVIIYITNSSFQDEVEMEVKIDENICDIDSYTNKYLWYKKISTFETLGNHTVEVKVKDKDISQKMEFFVLGAKFINVELVNQVVDDTYELQISVHSSPVVIE